MFIIGGLTGQLHAMRELGDEYKNQIASADKLVKAKHDEWEISELIRKTDKDAGKAKLKFKREKSHTHVLPL